jgi:hypothetical protein
VGEDLVGGLGPDEGVAALVPALDEGADRGDEFLDAVKGSAADCLLGDDAEEDLDQVQPSSTLPCSRRPRRCCRTAMTDLKDLTEEAAIAGDTREIRVTRGQQRFASWVTDVLVYIVVLGLFVE